MERKKKNNMIELCRFIACYAIFSYHAGGVLKSGWIFVEFFFILSGYFTFKHYMDKKDTITNGSVYPLQYTWKKLKGLLPYTTTGFILAGCMFIYWYGLKGMAALRWILYWPMNITYLAGMGLTTRNVPVTDSLNSVYLVEPALWYICCMFAAMPIMLYLLIWCSKKLGPWLVTFLPMFLYGLLLIWDGTFNGWHSDHLAFWALDIRALAGLLTGGLVYYIVRWLQKRDYTKLGVFLLTVCELFCFLVALGLAQMDAFDYDGLAVLVFVLLLSLSLSGKTATAKLNGKVFEFLGTISLAVYCIHNTLIGALHPLVASMDEAVGRHVTLLIILGLAIVMHLIIQLCKKLAPAWKQVAVKLLVKAEHE